MDGDLWPGTAPPLIGKKSDPPWAALPPTAFENTVHTYYMRVYHMYHTYTYTYTHVYVYVHVHAYVYVYVYVYVHTYVCASPKSQKKHTRLDFVYCPREPGGQAGLPAPGVARARPGRAAHESPHSLRREEFLFCFHSLSLSLSVLLSLSLSLALSLSIYREQNYTPLDICIVCIAPCPTGSKRAGQPHWPDLLQVPSPQHVVKYVTDVQFGRNCGNAVEAKRHASRSVCFLERFLVKFFSGTAAAATDPCANACGISATKQHWQQTVRWLLKALQQTQQTWQTRWQAHGSAEAGHQIALPRPQFAQSAKCKGIQQTSLLAP